MIRPINNINNDEVNNHLEFNLEPGSNNYLNDEALLPTAASPRQQQQQQQQVVTVVPIDKDAPSSDNWYHGRVDRLESEERLRQENKPGGFLVRESERKPGSFVLSYYSLKSNIYHFKITAVFGDYYIGGRQFDRLETLISYYMYYSELVKGEKLLCPIPPGRICKLEKTYLSIRPYPNSHPPNYNYFNSTNNQYPMSNGFGNRSLTLGSIMNNNNEQTNEVALLNNGWNSSEDILYFDKVGEQFRVYHEVGEGDWFWAQSCRTNEFGLLSADCVIRVENDRLHEIEPWFYPDITKEEAANILANVGNCSYLVRPSEQAPGHFTLFYYVDNVVHRYRITECVDEGRNDEFNNCSKYYHIGGRDFSSIPLIIARYMHEDIIEGYRLSRVPHKRPDIYAVSIDSFLQTILSNEQLEFSQELQRKLDRKHSFKKKSSSLSNSEPPGFAALPKRNSLTTGHITTTANKENKLNEDLIKENYLNLPDLRQANQKLSMSLNEASLRSALAIPSPSPSVKTQATQKPAISKKTAQLSLPNNGSPVPRQTQIAVSKSTPSPFTLNNNRNNTGEDEAKDLSTSQTGLKQLKSIGPEILNRKTDKIVIKGYLNKYNEKTKKWKPYWFSLNQTDQQLFYFSNEKRMKEKGLIDLTYGFYYPLDDSFFNKMFCFQIIIHSLGSTNGGASNPSNNNSSIAHYLSADNYQMFKEWTENIRPLCNPIQFNPFVSQSFGASSMSCLSLSSSTSTSSSSTSSSSSSSSSSAISSSTSSPLSISLNDSNKPTNHHHNYRILRTLSIDIHEARNVCFSPLPQTSPPPTSNPQPTTANNTSTLQLPKFHKENLYYCLILFNNDAFVASTRLSTCNTAQSSSSQTTPSSLNNNQSWPCGGESKDSIWDDSFSFDNLPLDVKEIKLCLFVIAKPSNFPAAFVNNLKKISNPTGGGKMSDPVMIGSVSVKLDDLINKGLCESWYSVEPTVLIGDEMSAGDANTCCSMRVKIRFCEERIHLDKGYYEELSAFLMNEREHKHLCTLYEQIVPSTERAHFIHALLRLYIVNNNIVEMLKSFLLTEIDRCTDLSTLFRPATMATSLMEHYMRTRCDDFLHKALEEPLVRIFKLNNASQSQNVCSFELDPTKCGDASQREQNLANFQQALRELIVSITHQTSVDLFPNELKHLFSVIRQHVQRRHQLILNTNCQQHTANTSSENKLLRIYCVSAFVFLRLLCPALLNPKSFGLKFFNTTTTTTNNSPQQIPNKNILDYTDLAQKFSVFTPSFMFTLTPNPAHTTLHPPQQQQQPIKSPTNSATQVTCFSMSSIVNNNTQSTNLSTNTTNSSSSSTSTPSSNSPSASLQLTAFYDRHIKLLAKVLQTLANMTECKEAFMLPLSEFLNLNKPNIIKFIEEISSLNELNSSGRSFDGFKDEMSVQFENADCKYLAILHRILNSFVPQMKAFVAKANLLSPNPQRSLSLDDAANNNSPKLNEQTYFKIDDIGFVNSLQKLINILNDINCKTKL